MRQRVGERKRKGGDGCSALAEWCLAVPGLLQDGVDGRLLPVLHALRTPPRRSRPWLSRGGERRAALPSSASLGRAPLAGGGADACTPAALTCRWPRCRQVQRPSACAAQRQALPDSTHVWAPQSSRRTDPLLTALIQASTTH